LEILVHLDVAYRVARRLLRDDHDAQDVVQDALLRAIRYFAGFRGTSGRAWLLAIVRNTCRTRRRRDWLRMGVEFDETHHGDADAVEPPERAVERSTTGATIERALAGLAEPLREVVVLREVEGLPYKEIAAVMNVPIGTVMSRLARARAQLEQALTRAGERVS
jgi:RNA polymerase sigma-70 factor (ECF subfamily)